MKAKQTDGQEQVPGSETSGALIDAVMEISRERAKILLAMKEALLRGDEDEALERARELTGLPSKRTIGSR
jgi:hypothetical protein